MAKDQRGAGDPVRTLELLWREPGQEPRPGRRGPRQGLSVDAVVRAAIALADADWLAALTTRALAQRLGVTPMTLYTYVPARPSCSTSCWTRRTGAWTAGRRTPARGGR